MLLGQLEENKMKKPVEQNSTILETVDTKPGFQSSFANLTQAYDPESTCC
jgi:hypothetical protein